MTSSKPTTPVKADKLTPSEPSTNKLSALLQGLENCQIATSEQSGKTFALVGAEAFRSPTKKTGR